MEIRYGKSLEFEQKEKYSDEENCSSLNIGDDVGDEDIIREEFRTPIGQTNRISVTIDGRIFPVINISAGGVGVCMPDSVSFKIQDQINDILLDLAGTCFLVNGIVVHIDHDEGKYLCGIEFISPGSDCIEALDKIVLKTKTNLFIKKPA